MQESRIGEKIAVYCFHVQTYISKKSDQRQQTSVLTYCKINTGEQLEQTGDTLMQETSPTSGEEVVVRCFHVQTYMLKN